MKRDAKLESSLYEGLVAAGEAPSLAVQRAEVFAWDIDFYNDPRKGDTIREHLSLQLLRPLDEIVSRLREGEAESLVIR